MFDLASALPEARWYGRLARLPLRLIPKGTVVPVLQGPLSGSKWIVGSMTHGAWLGTYERARQQAMMRLVKPGSVVYDLGANVGFYTLLASHLGATVVAVEPLPRNIDYLRRHVRINRCPNVTLIEAAVVDREGEVSITGDAALARVAHRAPSSPVVSATTLDCLVRSLPPPTIIKCDVEGAEARVLDGACEAIARYRPIWLFSTHSDELRRTCHARLRDAGYRITQEGDNPDEVIACWTHE
jgi:FkbM family methyltransferase